MTMATTPSAATDADERIRLRARWEAFELSVPEPGRVTVVNHSYGVDPDKHTYTVTVEDGRAVECTCLHFEHRKTTCKHMVRVEEEPAVMAAASAVLPDGGRSATYPCVRDDPECPGPDGDDLPCFACYSEQVARP